MTFQTLHNSNPEKNFWLWKTFFCSPARILLACIPTYHMSEITVLYHLGTLNHAVWWICSQIWVPPPNFDGSGYPGSFCIGFLCLKQAQWHEHVSKQPQAIYNVSSMRGFKKKFDKLGTFRISAQVRNSPIFGVEPEHTWMQMTCMEISFTDDIWL
jgi:hypothetical protein